MIKLIVGSKGSGKTKTVIDMINNAAKTSNGNVVVIEKSMALTYNIDHSARLIDLSEYDIKGADAMYGFMAGILAGNYDITHVFIDSLTKIVTADVTDHAVEEFLDWLNSFSEKNNIKFTVTISADASLATEGIKKYF